MRVVGFLVPFVFLTAGGDSPPPGLTIAFHPAVLNIFSAVYKATTMELPLCLHGKMSKDTLTIYYVTLADVHPDSISDKRVGGFQCLSERVAGTAHVHRGTPGMDELTVCTPSVVDLYFFAHNRWAIMQVIVCGEKRVGVWLHNEEAQVAEGALCTTLPSFKCEMTFLVRIPES